MEVLYAFDEHRFYDGAAVMDIMQCGPSDRAHWDAFVDRSPRCSFYHRFDWSEVHRVSLGHASSYLAAVEDGKVAGVLPIVRVKGWVMGDVACSLPFVNYGGPVADSEDIERALVQEGIHVSRTWGVRHLEIRNRWRLGSDLPCSHHKISLWVSLEAGADGLWNSFKTAHRQDIRRGYKNGFFAKLGGAELLDDFYEVLLEAWRDLGTPLYDKRYFRNVLQTFGESVRICVVYAASEPAAASLQARHGVTGEGLWLGSRSCYRRQHAGYVLYWELLKDAAEQGCRHFHLGRSTADSGAEAFKRKWNADVRPLFWHYAPCRKPAPQPADISRRFAVAVEVWKKLPLSVARRLGPWIAPQIP